MEFFNQTGKMAIGSRLRMLTESITHDAANIYKLYKVDLSPKWFPVFYVLSQGDSTISAIASRIGHSHPSVSKIASEMMAKGLLTERRDRIDRRKTMLALSSKGKELRKMIKYQYADVGTAIDEIMSATQHDLWKAIEEWEYLLQEQSLLDRVRAVKKKREASAVKIVEFKKKYRKAFRALNEEWITKYFEIEKSDSLVLNNPEMQILQKGGFIFVAVHNNEPVGVCALMKSNDPVYDYELAKMAVRPDMQGRNIGWLLGQTVIAKARQLGASDIFLESNTILKPAISLYKKLGFRKVAGHESPYKRSNIQMALELK